ncbi:MAG: hypothetical protein JO019_03910 [Candidatus Kaiserbacteria bacterium]|nr:hypothetical protein [Candidatus Kaiserbacteria bacterium]
MQRVFKRPSYTSLSLLIALVCFLLIAWLPSTPLIADAVSKGAFPIATQLLIGSIADLPPAMLMYSIAFSLLIGINVALLLFYYRAYRAAPGIASVSGGIAGTLAALFGFACVACGSIFFTGLLATIGGTSVIAFLPYQGQEIGVIGIALLLISAYSFVRAINKPPVCPI